MRKIPIVLGLACGCVLAALPALVCAESSPPPVPDSLIRIPVHLDLRPLAAYADSQIPQSEDSDWQDTGQHVLGADIAVMTSWTRSPISIEATGDTLTVRTTVSYKARVGAGGPHQQLAECGWDGTEPTLDISLQAALDPQPDWSLDPRITVPEPTVGSHCVLTKLHIDASKRVADAVQKRFLAMVSGFHDRLAAKLNFHAQGEQAWLALARPYPLPGQDPRYLTLDPTGASLSPLVADSDGNGVSIVLGLVVHPAIAAGAAPESHASDLPFLETGTGDGLLRIVMPVDVSYADLESTLNAKYAGKDYQFGGYPETIDKIGVQAAGQALLLTVTMHGKADAEVKLQGSPAYDEATRTFYLDNLDYTLDTKNLIAGSASWLMHSRLREMLQSQARVDLTGQVEALKKSGSEALNRPLGKGVTLSGRLDAVKPYGFEFTTTGITAYLAAEGSAQVNLD